MATVTARPLPLMAALLLALGSVGQAQVTGPPPRAGGADFRVEIFGDGVADFNARVREYRELRTRLETGLSIDEISEDPATFLAAQRALARRIRVARRGAVQGDIFTPAAAREFKRGLQATIDATTFKLIINEDNPGQLRHRINGDYPDGMPFSTMPANILALLPELPGGLQFRFLGRHLVLYDTRASVILDRIPYAIECRTCDD